MKLLTLNLENFQGIRKAEYQFSGHSASIFGDNATGKTTIFNAFTWLLFDKASTGAKSFSPKTKGSDGDLHNLDHSVEASFSLEDGRIITLKKVFHEIYKKKRGSAQEEFDGHTTDYYVDLVPSNEKEFQATLLSCCNATAEMMKILTVPHYFPEEMAWDARRKILLEMCGDVSDEEIISASPLLADLPSYLLMPGTKDQYRGVDEYRKIAAARKTDINRRLQEIPSRIDEATKAIPNIIGMKASDIETQIKSLTKQKNEIDLEAAQVLNGDIDSMATRNQISDLKASLNEAKVEHQKRSSDANTKVLQDIEDTRSASSGIRLKIAELRNNIRKHEDDIKYLTAKRESLVKRYKEVEQWTWDEGEAICPTCKQALPEESVSKLRETFNIDKSETLETINIEGKSCSQEVITSLKNLVMQFEEELRRVEKELDASEQTIAELQGKLVPAQRFEETAAYSEIMEAIAVAEASGKEKGASAEAAAGILSEKSDEIRAQIAELERQLASFAVAETQRRRITDLMDEEKSLSKEYENVERGIFLCEQFTKTKVSLLDDKINGKFKSVRFRLFQEQINGGIKDDCEAMIPGPGGEMVPFSFANNAARINAGLEIISALSLHWGLSLPVFVDNAESVTRLEAIDTQIIRLVVSENDKTLRLEIEEE